jgi:hypothetical protein
MVRVGDWKLTYQPLVDGAIYRLFDMRTDPGCQNNVLDQQPQIAARLKALLDSWIDDDPKSDRRGGSQTAGAARPCEPAQGGGFPAVSGNPA